MLLSLLMAVIVVGGDALFFFGSRRRHCHNPLRSQAAVDSYTERRWIALIDHCGGNWSGSIGWYQVTKEKTLELKPGSFERNMRLSFLPNQEDEETDWIVYHALQSNMKEVAKMKRVQAPTTGKDLQTFYLFEQGNLGRTGNDFSTLPVIEHGYWADGMRRTVCVIYDYTACASGEGALLDRICFLQQKRQDKNDFDVSGWTNADVAVLPRKHSLSLKQIRNAWKKSVKIERCEAVLPDSSHETIEYNEDQVLEFLLGNDDEEVLRVVLPNGVVLACPWYLPAKGAFQIAMAYQRKNGQRQATQFYYDEAKKLVRVVGSRSTA